MPGLGLSTVHSLFLLVFNITTELCRVTIYTLQVGKLKVREVDILVKSHTGESGGAGILSSG